MVAPPENTDGFLLDFDSLIDDPNCAQPEDMALSLVQNARDPFDLSLDHTPDHKNCPGCRKANAALQLTSAELAGMTFCEAGKAWMALRRQDRELKARTHEATLDHINQLGRFFAALRLRDITPGNIRAYQIARTNNLLRVNGVDVSP